MRAEIYFRFIDGSYNGLHIQYTEMPIVPDVGDEISLDIAKPEEGMTFERFVVKKRRFVYYVSGQVTIEIEVSR